MRARIGTLWFTKAAGTTFAISVFFVAYFWLLNHHYDVSGDGDAPDLARPGDRFPPRGGIRLRDPVGLRRAAGRRCFPDRREVADILRARVAGAGADRGWRFSCSWPTTLPHFDIDLGAVRRNFTKLKTADLAGNACPSLHVAFAVFAGIWLDRQLREIRLRRRIARRINWLWCFGIVYSTIAVRQHVALDALAGAVLGATVADGTFRALLRGQAPGSAHTDARMRKLSRRRGAIGFALAAYC